MNDDDLDRLLRRLPREEASPNFLRSIREIPVRHPHLEGRSFLFRPLFASLGLAFSLGLGIFVGAWSAEANPADGSTQISESNDQGSDASSLIDLIAPPETAQESIEL